MGELRDGLAVDMLVLLDKQMVLPEQWQRGQALMKREGNWERFATHVALAQTVDQLPAALDEPTLQKLLAGRTVKIRESGRSLHLALIPLRDVGRRHIGDLVVIRDITALEFAFQWSIAIVTAIGLLAAIGVLGAFYLALDRVEQDYRRQHDLEHQPQVSADVPRLHVESQDHGLDKALDVKRSTPTPPRPVRHLPSPARLHATNR